MTVFTSCPWCDDEQSFDPEADEFTCQSCGTSVLLRDEEEGAAVELAA